jgi:hypothetical protein
MALRSGILLVSLSDQATYSVLDMLRHTVNLQNGLEVPRTIGFLLSALRDGRALHTSGRFLVLIYVRG